MKIVRSLVLVVVAIVSFGVQAHAQANAFLAWEDARAIRRVATVAGKGMPEELLTTMSRSIVESLRGKQPGGTWQWAYYTREEASKAEESFGLKPRKGEENPAPVTLTGTLGYKVRLAVPSRRYLVARNREVEIQRAIVEYTNDKGETVTEEFPAGVKLEPGQHTELELKSFAWSPIVRVWAFSDEKLGKKASLSISISEPKLVDNPKSPYFGAVQQAQALPKAIDREDATEVRKLCDSIIATIEGVHPQAAERVNAMITRGEAPAPGAVPAPAALPSGIDKVELNRQLQEIEDLLTGTDAEKSEGMTKLRQLVRSTRP
jgi:hypothetical protein